MSKGRRGAFLPPVSVVASYGEQSCTAGRASFISHINSWPDGGMTPFRREKDTNWEGAFRVPLLVRWPGKIPAGKDFS